MTQGKNLSQSHLDSNSRSATENCKEETQPVNAKTTLEQESVAPRDQD